MGESNMPYRAKKPCALVGCGVLVESDERYCATHSREHQQEMDARRGNAASRGYGARWRKYREAYLRAKPLCEECEREHCVSAANVVDHIEPHKGDHKLMWDPRNHQALCKQCHDRKTAREAGTFGRGRAGEILASSRA